MNLDWMADPAWWALAISILSAATAVLTTCIAVHSARIAKAVAAVCHVDLQLTRGEDDDYKYEVHEMRRGRLTNHGDEVAVDVALDREASDIRVEEFLGRTLNKGEWIEFDMQPPTVTVEFPVGRKIDYSLNYQDMAISHKFYFTFRRPKGLGGEKMRREFRYEDVFGHEGREAEGS